MEHRVVVVAGVVVGLVVGLFIYGLNKKENKIIQHAAIGSFNKSYRSSSITSNPSIPYDMR